MYGTQTMMPYAGTNGMYTVHKFMALDNSQVGWFIYNVGLAATSFGVTASDAQAVGTALETLFGYRCEPPESVPSYEPPELQSICIDVSVTRRAYTLIANADATSSAIARFRQTQTAAPTGLSSSPSLRTRPSRAGAARSSGGIPDSSVETTKVAGRHRPRGPRLVLEHIRVRWSNTKADGR